jgi:FMN phosphatase YigB (HAD superfamily)
MCLKPIFFELTDVLAADMRLINTACFVDFDHTLFNTDEFFHVDVRNSFLGLGIEEDLWEQSYEAIWKTGYNLEKHAEEIYHQSSSKLSYEWMQRILHDSFSDLRRYVFSDVIPFLEDTKKRGARLYLLSFGNPEWQRYKVLASRLDTYFDDMFFIPDEGGKVRLILEYSNQTEQIVLIDNNPAELDLLKDAIPVALTYCINRVSYETFVPDDEQSQLKFLEARRYAVMPWRHQHIACRTLNGILSL